MIVARSIVVTAGVLLAYAGQRRLRSRGALYLSAQRAASSALEGRLYRYRESPSSLQAFESGPPTSKFCIYVGGLTDGLLACPYVERLAEECAAHGWALVQPLISSSYSGYGTGSLDRDVDELEVLARYLQAERGAASLALVGHSTGCQDAVHFMHRASAEARSLVRAVVLQAPVSDRESATLEGDAEERAAMLERAEALVSDGKGDTLFTLQYGAFPLTADRFASLNGRGGLDDMFSSDLSDDELRARLGHLAAPGFATLFAHSLCDEYVPSSVDVQALARRFVAAAGGATSATSLMLGGAKHNLDSPDGEAARLFVKAVGGMLRQIS